MKRIFLLIVILTLVLPQILVWSNPSPNECCGRQLRREVLGFASASSYVNVLVSQAKQMIESNPSLVILDVRSQAEYDSGHLQNATLIPSTVLARRLYELDRQKDILVYCGSGGRSATASQTLVDNAFPSVYNMLGGITSWKNVGYWIEIVHNGDLVSSGTQIFTIENCTYVQNGNILVRDSAQLTIRNAILQMNMTYSGQYNIDFEINSKSSIQNSTIISSVPALGYGVRYFDQVTAEIYGSELGPWLTCSGNSRTNITLSTFTALRVRDYAHVQITDSNATRTIDLALRRTTTFQFQD